MTMKFAKRALTRSRYNLAKSGLAGHSEGASYRFSGLRSLLCLRAATELGASCLQSCWRSSFFCFSKAWRVTASMKATGSTGTAPSDHCRDWITSRSRLRIMPRYVPRHVDRVQTAHSQRAMLRRRLRCLL